MIPRTHTNRIIWHHSLTDTGDVNSFRHYHMHFNGYEDIGYHAVILRDGTIQHGRDIRMIGAHAKGKNYDSIGVCLVGDFRYYEPSADQLSGCVQYVHMLSHSVAWTHPLKNEFHRPEWTPNACPGKMLNRKDFLEIVLGGYL